ncbi:HAD-like protein [Xylariaceae sp. FL0016]|nr:HAD-like protein [Xylariaceae sp. FL0016]
MSAAGTDHGANLGWRPEAIVFDLLTGLIDSWTLWDASTPSGSSTEGRRWRERYLKLTFGKGSYAPYEKLVRQAAEDVGLLPSAPEALLRDWRMLQPWPEDGEVLQTLRDRGYKLGVVTNCSTELGHIATRRVEECVEKGDFKFDAVITAEESGFYKPVKEAYQAILTVMGLEPADVLFVAGSAGDVQGATNAGMRVVWHNKIGLAGVGEAVAIREEKSLEGALQDFL